ncbi:hypothetical protein R6Q59_000509, partial [Mikania micrantha]
MANQKREGKTGHGGRWPLNFDPAGVGGSVPPNGSIPLGVWGRSILEISSRQSVGRISSRITTQGEDGRMKSAIGIGTLLQILLYKSIYIGLGDTLRVSLTELLEEEIDPCRKLANLGMKASQIQQGVAPFEEKHRRYFDFQRRTGDLPTQKEGEKVDYKGVLHLDGYVFMSVSLDQLK